MNESTEKENESYLENRKLIEIIVKYTKEKNWSMGDFCIFADLLKKLADEGKEKWFNKII